MSTKKFLDNEGLLYFWTKLKGYFVRKETGKGLSTNDLTDTLKSNYGAAYTHSTTAHAPSNAERNTLVGIQKNGTDVSINSTTRKANIIVPTKTSDITNDSGFITSADVPEGASASGFTPLMDGTAAKGTDNGFARGDHVHPSDTTKVDKVDGKGLSTNDYTTTEKNKLAAIASGAEVNQNAFSNIVVGSTTISADSKTDTLTLTAGSNVTITPNANNDTIIISSTNTTYSDATTENSGLMSPDDKIRLEDTAIVFGDITATHISYHTNDPHVVRDSGIAYTDIITTNNIASYIPTNNNQLTNGAGYQTSAQVESAITAKGYATTAQVATAIANAGHLKREKVTGSTLPSASASDVNTIYMLPITDATGNNKFTEWMVIDGAWEKTGDSDVDLSGYVQNNDLIAITNSEIDTTVAS